MEKYTRTSIGAVPVYDFGKKGNPGIVLLQEWWGVTTDILDQAEYIATTQKYRVIVPDLYRGKLSMEKEEAEHMMSHLDWKDQVLNL